MEHTILSFLKFGEEKYIKDLYENGTFYMNPVQKFREIEDKGLRGDPYEGASEVRNLPSGKFEIKSLNYKGEYISLHYKKSYDTVLGNLYCLYCISSKGFPDPTQFKVDAGNIKFGETCLMIKDCDNFMNRVRKGIENKGFQYHEGFVDYYDSKSYNGDITLFQKSLEYEYQKEFRFYVVSGKDEPIILNLGSLKDISSLYNTTDIINGLELVVK